MSGPPSDDASQVGDVSGDQLEHTLTASERGQLQAALALLQSKVDEQKFVGLLMVCKLEGIGDKYVDEAVAVSDHVSSDSPADASEAANTEAGDVEDGSPALQKRQTVRQAIFEAVGRRFVLRLLKTRGSTAGSRYSFAKISLDLLSFFSEDVILCEALRPSVSYVAQLIDEFLTLLLAGLARSTASKEQVCELHCPPDCTPQQWMELVHMCSDATTSLLRILQQPAIFNHQSNLEAVVSQVISASPGFGASLLLFVSAVFDTISSSPASSKWDESTVSKLVQLRAACFRVSLRLWNRKILRKDSLSLLTAKSPSRNDPCINLLLLERLCLLLDVSEPPFKFELLEVVYVLLSSSPASSFNHVTKKPHSWLPKLKNGLVDIMRGRNIDILVKNTAFALLGALIAMFERRSHNNFKNMSWTLVGEVSDSNDRLRSRGSFLKLCLHLAAIEIKLALDFIAGHAFKDGRVAGSDGVKAWALPDSPDFTVPGFSDADSSRISACLQIVQSTIDALCDESQGSLVSMISGTTVLSYRQPLLNSCGIILEFIQETALIVDSASDERIQDLHASGERLEQRVTGLLGRIVSKQLLAPMIVTALAWLAEEQSSSPNSTTLAFLLRWHTRPVTIAGAPFDPANSEPDSQWATATTLPYLVPWLCLLTCDSDGCEQLTCCCDGSEISSLGAIGLLFARTLQWVSSLSGKAAARSAPDFLSVDDVAGILRCVWYCCRDKVSRQKATSQVAQTICTVGISGVQWILDQSGAAGVAHDTPLRFAAVGCWAAAIVLEAVIATLGAEPAMSVGGHQLVKGIKAVLHSTKSVDDDDTASLEASAKAALLETRRHIQQSLASMNGEVLSAHECGWLHDV